MNALRTPREWPLIVGMVLAAALVFVSTRVGTAAPQTNRVPSISPTAKQAAVTGFAPAATPAPAASGKATKKPPHTTHAAKKPAHKAKAAAASPAPKAAAPKATKPATTTPESDTGGTSAPSQTKPTKQQPPAPATPAPAALSVPADSGQTTVGGITFTVRSTHKPLVGQDWTMTVAAARGTKPVAGKAALDVVYQGKVARHVTTAKLRRGSFAKTIVWPQRSAGYPLTIRIKMTAGGQRCTFLYDLQVQPAQ